jgi:hypothetical protein
VGEALGDGVDAGVVAEGAAQQRDEGLGPFLTGTDGLTAGFADGLPTGFCGGGDDAAGEGVGACGAGSDTCVPEGCTGP